jgi:hypothetical protein
VMQQDVSSLRPASRDYGLAGDFARHDEQLR